MQSHSPHLPAKNSELPVRLHVQVEVLLKHKGMGRPQCPHSPLRSLARLHHRTQWLHCRFVLALKEQALGGFAVPGVGVVEEGDESGGGVGAEFGDGAGFEGFSGRVSRTA